jgi:hypothetical protein
MYPRLQYDLPILSMDLVANDGRVSLAIVDPCPVSASLDLPPFYDAPVRWGTELPSAPLLLFWRHGMWQHVECAATTLGTIPAATNPQLRLPELPLCPICRCHYCCRELQTRYGLKSNREVPEWGRAIFSPLCVIMRPTSADELGRFLKYTLALNQMHVQVGAGLGREGVGG